MIVAEMKAQSKCNREDQGLLSFHVRREAQVAYILTLGVVKCERRNGTATSLLNKLIHHLTRREEKKCLAIYLHVLTTNSVAISFYEKHNFQRHLYLPLYYSIEGSSRDGYSYVLYINNGRPPFNPFSSLRSISCFSINLLLSLFLPIYTWICSPSFSWLGTSCFKHSRLKKILLRFVNYTSRLFFQRQEPSHSKYSHLANA